VPRINFSQIINSNFYCILAKKLIDIMKKILFLLVLSMELYSCKSSQVAFTSVKTTTLLVDKISIRPITISNDKVYYAADKNRVGVIDLKNNSKQEYTIEKDDLKLEFRSIAQTSNSIFVANVGNPVFIYKFSKDLQQKELVYEEHNTKVFYDSMQFWNDQEGIAIGDPIENCLCMLITRDGGATWTKVSCSNLPEVNEGEAAFAASNTNIVIKGECTWIVSGGKKARVFFSSDKGKTWSVYTTPIIQGETMTGIFTADFYNDKIGFISGGNYEKPNQNFGNKALTANGGKTWDLVYENQGFGYASCVQYVPNSNGKQLVSVGANGLYYSSNKGKSWTQLSKDGTLYTIRFVDNHTAIAAGKDKMVKLSFDKKSDSSL
jgi:photosystem II stability/assembly factor-like uncharacterized protein